MLRVTLIYILTGTLAFLPHQSPSQTACPPSPTDQVIEQLAAEVFTSPDIAAFQSDLSQFDQVLAMVKPLAALDPCLARQIDILAGMLHALRREIVEADEIFRRHMGPSLERTWTGSTVDLMAEAAYISVLAFQRRDEEASARLEALRRVVRARFDLANPIAISIEGMAADLFAEQQRYQDAEAVFAELMPRIENSLAPRHPVRCASVVSRADVALRLGKIEMARMLVADALDADNRACNHIFDGTHPWQASALRIRGEVLLYSGAPAAAVQDFTRSEMISRRAYDLSHPDVIAALAGRAEAHALLGSETETVRALAALETALARRTEPEIHGISDPSARQRIIAGYERHQVLALRIAADRPGWPGAQRAAASAILKFKGRQAEADGLLARLVQSPNVDQEIQVLGSEVRRLRSAFATATTSGALGQTQISKTEIQRRSFALADAEAALAIASRQFARQRALRQVTPEAVQNALAGYATPTALIEYRKMPARALGTAPPNEQTIGYWTATLIAPDLIRTTALPRPAEIGAYVDLATDHEFIQSTIPGLPNFEPRSAETLRTISIALHNLLLAPAKIEAYGRVVVSVDAELALLNFGSLRRPDGQYLVQGEKHLEVVQTGRSLIPSNDTPPKAKGFVGFGAVDYWAATTGTSVQTPKEQVYPPLKSTFDELQQLGVLFERTLGEPVTLFLGPKATEDALINLKAAPRVLHLSTHGFFDKALIAKSGRTTLASGIALAGANWLPVANQLKADGVLYAIEAQMLNLQGTEIVTLSACRSGQGVVERGEGLNGLARAFRIAGAQNFLVAVRPVRESHARAVTDAFYRHWMKGGLTPSAAFDQGIRDLLAEGNQVDWSAYTLLSGGH